MITFTTLRTGKKATVVDDNRSLTTKLGEVMVLPEGEDGDRFLVQEGDRETRARIRKLSGSWIFDL